MTHDVEGFFRFRIEAKRKNGAIRRRIWAPQWVSENMVMPGDRLVILHVRNDYTILSNGMASNPVAFLLIIPKGTQG
jgi:hypothetical protein